MYTKKFFIFCAFYLLQIEEMKEYLLNELKEERYKMLMNQENKYSYLFMLMNDMGFTESEE